MRIALPVRAVRRRTGSGRRPTLLLMAGLPLLLAAFGQAAADDPAGPALPSGEKITRVEEDWLIEVGDPQPDDYAPQIITVLSPTGTLNQAHSVFELNHVTFPEFLPGGAQLQLWYGEAALKSGTSPFSGLLATPGEKIRFTSSMELGDGGLTFSIRNGQSVTWGDFGGTGYLKVRIESSLKSLDGYRPDVSVKHSRIGFASHRVRKLSLRQVRYYAGDELVATDSQERVVHEHVPEVVTGLLAGAE